jgi:hypothetical protein
MTLPGISHVFFSPVVIFHGGHGAAAPQATAPQSPSRHCAALSPKPPCRPLPPSRHLALSPKLSHRCRPCQNPHRTFLFPCPP